MSAILGVLIVLAVLVGIVLGARAYVRWRLGKRNRVVAATPSPAPLTWLVLPTIAAVLHRRLRAAIQVAHMADGTPGIEDLLRDLEAHAVNVDAHLVIAARLRKTRGHTMRDLVGQVEGIEHVARRVATAAFDARRPAALPGPADEPLERIGARLDALEQARAELLRLERSAGLERLA